MRPLLLLSALAVIGAAPPPGALSCTGCHAPSSGMGALDGAAADATDAAMAGFRDGTRPATLMDRIAKGFTAEQTDAIAVWFAQQ